MPPTVFGQPGDSKGDSRRRSQVGPSRRLDQAFRKGRNLFRRALREVTLAETKLDRAEAHLRSHPPKVRLDEPSREERAWRAMIASCDNPRSRHYKSNGARGIRVAPRWRIFLNFILDMGSCPPGFVLTRLNINGDFEPANCKWVSTSQLPFRRRPKNSRFIVYDGQLRSVPSLARQFNLGYHILFGRVIRRGETVEQAVAGARHRQEALCRCPLGKGRSNLADVGAKEVEHD